MNKKKLIAILTLMCFLFAFMPVAAMAKADVVLPEATENWGASSDGTYIIANASDLVAFTKAAETGNTFSGKTVKLIADIDLGGATWTPIKQFSGTLDGGNYTISNFHLESTNNNQSTDNDRTGFIKNLGQYPATVKNLKLDNITGNAGNNQYFGVLVANGHTSILDNIHISNVKVTTRNDDAWVGGFYGYFNWTTTTNCTLKNFEVDASQGAKFIGGFSGNMDQDLEIKNVDIDGFKVTVNDSDNDCAVGGFTGQTQTGHRQPTFANCDITGLDITATGIVDVGGFVADPGAHTITNNCTVAGNIDATGVTSTSCSIGGFFADAGWNNNESNKGGHKITNCSADVNIMTGGAAAGGFIGSVTNDNNRNMPITIINCSASGDITATYDANANIGAFAGEADRGTYTNCSASGNVVNNGNGTDGQFIGEVEKLHAMTLTDCSYTGTSTEEFIGNIPQDASVTVKNNAAQIGNTKYTTLEAAIEAAEATTGDVTITLLADVEEDVKVTQKNGLNLTIDGTEDNAYKFAGVMTVFGNGRQAGTETLTIKNIDFVAKNGADSCIVSPDRTDNNAYSYSHNVKVDNCTFTDSDGTVNCAAIRHKDGGDKNWTVTNCTVASTMHSLLQVNNVVDKLTVDNCTVESKNGINLNSCTNVEITNSDFNVQGYAIRSGVNTGGNLGEEKTIVLKNNTLKSVCEDGDAVIMLRASAVDANITMDYNAVMGTTHISGTTNATTVSADANYWNGGTAPVVAEGSTAVEVASYYTVYTASTSEDGTFTLSNYVEPATGISLTEAATVQEGKTITLTATLEPEGATGEVTWISSDETIATVDNGLVTGVKAGTATVTVKVESGDNTYTDTCAVTVTENSAPITPSNPPTSSSSGGGFSGVYNYPVNIGDVDGADVTLSDSYATKGETVTITIDPDMGKKVDEVIVTDADGDIISVTKVGDNKYTFVMPAGKVNVSVTTENADYDLRIVMQINNKNIVNNNKTITNDVSPVIVGDRTLVPVRIVTELLGGTADWDEATRTVTLTIDGKVLKLVIGEEIPGYGTGATIINDRTYVPIRYISEMLGAQVEWIAATQQIVIEK